MQRRIAELRASGALEFDVDAERGRLGLRISALLWLTVAPADLAPTGTALAGHPAVRTVESSVVLQTVKGPAGRT